MVDGSFRGALAAGGVYKMCWPEPYFFCYIALAVINGGDIIFFGVLFTSKICLFAEECGR